MLQVSYLLNALIEAKASPWLATTAHHPLQQPTLSLSAPGSASTSPPWTLQMIRWAVMQRLEKCMHNQIAKKIFTSPKHQRFHWQADEWHQDTVFYVHAKEVTKCWWNPTRCGHFIWPYLIYKWCSICRPLVFLLLHTVEKFNTEKPADGNGSKGNSCCFQIVHVMRALYKQWIPCQIPLQRPHTKIMVWIYNW
jgi:hypothetical protein